MNEDLYVKCSCQRCGTHIEFPIHAAGMTVDCPGCQTQTMLSMEAPPPADHRPASPEILNAFQGPVPRTRGSLLYRFGLVPVEPAA